MDIGEAFFSSKRTQAQAGEPRHSQTKRRFVASGMPSISPVGANSGAKFDSARFRPAIHRAAIGGAASVP
jgi:hypothetical protein